MFKKNKFWIAFGMISLLQSCSINTETTYFKDSATSLESNIKVDKTMLGMMNMMSSSSPSGKMPDLGKLSTEWKSLYDIQKDNIITLNQDSVKVLKKLYVKLNKNENDVSGISLKYDKLQPKEIVQLFTQSKHLKNIPMQNIAKWNGKVLTIDTEKFNIANALQQIADQKDEVSTVPKTKSDSIEAYGKKMASGMIGMMKMFNMSFNNTLKFQNPIKSITGKHDFVKQIDDRTIQISVRTNDLLDDGKKLVNKDKKIVIVTQ